MKIVTKLLSFEEFEKFADRNGLTLEIVEREPGCMLNPTERFYAKFQNVGVADGNLTRGAFGNGVNPQQAVAEYAKRISHQTLREEGSLREIKVPKLICSGLECTNIMII